MADRWSVSNWQRQRSIGKRNEFSGILIPHTRLFCARELESKQVGSGSRCGGIALQSDGASILRHRYCKALINNVI